MLKNWNHVAQQREMVVQLGSDDLGLRAVGNPIKIEGHRTRYGAPPLLDEHREEVLLGRIQA